jgi:DnaJ-domain-containing protein 1
VTFFGTRFARLHGAAAIIVKIRDQSRALALLKVMRVSRRSVMSAEQPRVLVASIVCTLMAPLAVFALGTAPQVDPPDSDVPTAIERALIERTCRATELSTKIDAHRQCLNAQMLWLRSDFGRDLSRLAGPDRRRIDAACSRLSAAGQREAYLDCLGNQLVTLHNRRNRGNPAVTQEVAVAVAASPLLAPLAAPVQTHAASSWTSAMVIGGTLGTVFAAAGFVFLTRRSRRAPHRCRTCGVDVPDSDLCPICRHEAAEALRGANAERAQNQRAQEEEERRQHEQEMEQQEQRARDEHEARMREQEMARQLAADEELRQADAAVLPVVSPAEKLAPVVDELEVFDPHAVLGVPHDAGLDDIRTAYDQARTKYDPDLVSHLGDEARAHFKAKAESVERAYQILSDVRR